MVNKLLMPCHSTVRKRYCPYGVELSRTTMCKLGDGGGRSVESACAFDADQIRAGPYVQIDETPLQVLEDPGSTSQMWVYRAASRVRRLFSTPTILRGVETCHSSSSTGIGDGFRRMGMQAMTNWAAAKGW